MNSYVGYGNFTPGSSGTATVAGTGSVWNSSNIFVVGNTVQGTLNISLGGTVNSAGTNEIGGFLSGTGTVNVDGAGSLWNQTGTLIFGDESAASGTLNITNGGKTTSQNVTMAEAAGSVAAATINGTTSEWSITGGLIIGNEAGATVTVQNGGLLTTNGTTTTLAAVNTGVGIVNVTGAGSQWSAGTVRIGQLGDGTVNVTNGGTVNASSTTIGNNGGFTSELIVNGTGSLYNNTGNMFVGGNTGTGEVKLSSGGRLSVTGNLTLGQLNNATGRIIIGTGGTGGTLDVTEVVGSAAGFASSVDFNPQ
ncbi:MAG: hypothetical protein HC901_03335 [Bdellovibrionaceae bacterium]|nr:hypothetical protein [Pseudobdellovibrionaceae bacterium]